MALQPNCFAPPGESHPSQSPGKRIIDRGQAVLRGEVEDALAIEEGERIGDHQEAIGLSRSIAPNASPKSSGSRTPKDWTVTPNSFAAAAEAS